LFVPFGTNKSQQKHPPPCGFFYAHQNRCRVTRHLTQGYSDRNPVWRLPAPMT